MVTGIYGILNLKTGMIYVGSAKDVRHRWYKHKRELRLNKHPNSYLQNVWNKYGEKAFEFILLEETPLIRSVLLEREEYHLIKYKEAVYNLRQEVSSNLGLKASIKTKKLMSLISKRRWRIWRLKHKDRIITKHCKCGKDFSDISFKIKNKKNCSAKCAYKYNVPWNKGKRLPKWIRNKFRQAKLKNPVTPWKGKKRPKKTRELISKSLIGRKLTKKHRVNIGKGHLGRKNTKKTIRLMSLARKRYYRQLRKLQKKGN